MTMDRHQPGGIPVECPVPLRMKAIRSGRLPLEDGVCTWSTEVPINGDEDTGRGMSLIAHAPFIADADTRSPVAQTCALLELLDVLPTQRPGGIISRRCPFASSCGGLLSGTVFETGEK